MFFVYCTYSSMFIVYGNFTSVHRLRRCPRRPGRASHGISWTLQCVSPVQTGDRISTLYAFRACVCQGLGLGFLFRFVVSLSLSPPPPIWCSVRLPAGALVTYMAGILFGVSMGGRASHPNTGRDDVIMYFYEHLRRLCCPSVAPASR